ncbi:MAG: DUF6390 family protein [Patescibacteria group bacterium]
MNGLRLAVIYSLKPHQLGFCGPKRVGEKLLNFILGKFKDSQEIKKILEKFRGFYPYLKLIAQANKISNPFDERVVEAYWLGNKFLEKVKIKDLKNLIKKEFKRKIKIPKNIFPHHSFHVFYLGSISGKIKLTEKLKDLCRISWGKVLKIENCKLKINKILVEYQPIVIREKAIYLGEPKQKWIDWDKRIVPKIKIGDNVSFHWNFLCQVLTKRQTENLNYYTRKNIYPLNPKISPVVHVFLKNRDKILILKRSNLLFTYPKLWNVIGGYIEKGDDLLERAIKEVEEETKIKRRDLKFIKRAKPYKVEDKSINKIWVTYPFLFETKTDKIKIDWEHTKYRWIKPNEIKNYRTVPKLEKGLKLLI